MVSNRSERNSISLILHPPLNHHVQKTFLLFLCLVKVKEVKGEKTYQSKVDKWINNKVIINQNKIANKKANKPVLKPVLSANLVARFTYLTLGHTGGL